MIELKQFKRIYIEITNCCNLQCSFCPPTKRAPKFMSVEEFEMVLNRIKGHGSYIYLHLKGEPLLHPEFDEIIALCEDYKVKVTLTTNGTLLLKRLETLMNYQCIRQVSLSLQSYERVLGNEEWYEYFEEVLKVVNLLRTKTKVISELRLWNYEDNMSNVEGEQNYLVIELIEQRLDLKKSIYNQLQKGKGIKLLEQVYLSRSYEFRWPDLSLPVIDEVGTCYGLRQQVGILVNGDVVPCCLDSEGDIVLGNIYEETFEEIVTSKRATQMIAGFENRQIVEPLCQRCGYRKRFNK